MKTYKIFDAETNEHEYNVHIKEDKNGDRTFSLHYSFANHWSENLHGKEIYTVVNNGNEFIINKSIAKTLNYGDFERIRIFLNFIEKYDGNVHSYNVYAESAFNI